MVSTDGLNKVRLTECASGEMLSLFASPDRANYNRQA